MGRNYMPVGCRRRRNRRCGIIARPRRQSEGSEFVRDFREAAHRHRGRDHWRGSVWAVPGVRARSAGHDLPPGRFAGRTRRTVHRAVPRQADLRHSGAAGVRRAGAGRPPAAADRAVQCAAASRPGSHAAAQARGRPLRRRDRARHALRCRRGGHRRWRRLVPAAAHRRAERGSVRRHATSIIACATPRSTTARSSRFSAAAIPRSTGSSTSPARPRPSRMFTGARNSRPRPPRWRRCARSQRPVRCGTSKVWQIRCGWTATH